MKLTSPITLIAPGLSRAIHTRCRRLAFAAVILVAAAHVAVAQTPAAGAAIVPQLTPAESLVASDALAASERQRDVLENAASAAITVAASQRPAIVIQSPA